jgi:NADPH-dependent 2,4-dienoyl-CoA reductase/sulfur reductase-like enzyme
MPGHHVIVGSGIAGLAAAEAIRAADASATITLVSEEAHDFYSRPGLAYLLRGDIPEKQLFIRNREDVRALQMERVNARVEQVHPAQHEVVLSTQQRIRYDRLLLSTGATAVPPQFPGGDLVGVVKLDSLDDARQILKLAGRRRMAVVVGGGITALELVEGLHARRMTVHYFMRSARYWSDVLDETESHIVLERLKHEGVILHTNTQVKQAIGSGGKLSAVQTEAGETIPCHVLAVAIGVRPRIDLAKKAGLPVDRGVLVNAYLQTSVPDIFAAGDVAQVHDPITGKGTVDVLWSTALVQGRVAGANMTGAGIGYVKGIPFNVTQLGGLKVTIVGAVGRGKDDDLVSIARGDAEAWRLLPKAWVLADQNDVNRLRLMLDQRRLVGALVMGDQTWSRPLQRLIAAQADISPIRDALIQGGKDALGKLAEYYQQWQRTVRPKA